MLLIDSNVMFFAFSLLNVVSCPWAFLITVCLGAGDAVLPDITM